MTRVVIFPPIYAETARAFMSRFELFMNAGDTASEFSIIMDYSDDGGRIFKNPRTLLSGPPGAFHKRLFATRLGSFRNRTIRLRMMTDQRVALYNAYADITGGET